MLHHFKKSIDIGNGHGGIVSQLKYDNEILQMSIGSITRKVKEVKSFKNI